MTVDVVRQWGLASLGSRLVRIGERLRSHTQDLMDAHGVPIQVHHYPLLTALRENGVLPISELASSLGVSQPGVTRSVNQLSREGFVRVERGSEDKRVRLVSITDSGVRLVDYAEQNLWPLVNGRLASVLDDRPDTLLSLLNQLEDRIANRRLFVEEPEEHHG